MMAHKFDDVDLAIEMYSTSTFEQRIGDPYSTWVILRKVTNFNIKKHDHTKCFFVQSWSTNG